MGAWVLGIAGIITLTVLLDMLIPDGQMNKYIKGVCALATILVIVAPLPSLISGGQKTDFGQVFEGGEGEYIDETALEEFYKSQVERYETLMMDYLAENGYKVGVRISAVGGIYGNIEKVEIFSIISGIAEKNLHIYMNEIKNLTAAKLGIGENLIVQV